MEGCRRKRANSDCNDVREGSWNSKLENCQIQCSLYSNQSSPVIATWLFGSIKLGLERSHDPQLRFCMLSMVSKGSGMSKWLHQCEPCNDSRAVKKPARTQWYKLSFSSCLDTKSLVEAAHKMIWILFIF